MIPQQETDTIHVSKFQLLLHSQPVGLGLLVELSDKWRRTTLVSFMLSAHDFASDAFEVLPLLQ